MELSASAEYRATGILTSPKLIVPFQIGRPADLALAGVLLFFVIRFLTWHGFLQLFNRFLVSCSACFIAAMLHLDRWTGAALGDPHRGLLFLFISSPTYHLSSSF